MATVETTALRKEFGDPKSPVVALDGIDLSVRTGEMLVLVGPSGCGKTTLLRCIAGLESATSGSIAIGDTPVFDAARKLNVPPYERDIAMVFQKYALWPHMTVLKNVEYPLRARGRKRALREGRAVRALQTVRCENLAARIPAQLSGGQQQRVALARAIASDPAVLLLDEPLSNLDALLRLELREELRTLHRSVGFTGVYVTHDQGEALSLGDRVAVMRSGVIQQLATAEVVFDRPATPEVASFLGIRNHVKVRLDQGAWATRFGPLTGFTGSDHATEIELFARPETVELMDAAVANSEVWSLGKGEVEETLFGGSTIEYVVRLDDERFVVTAPRGKYTLKPGDPTALGFRRESTLMYAGGALVS